MFRLGLCAYFLILTFLPIYSLSAATCEPTGSIKWFPGHYAMTNTENELSILSSGEVFRGIQKEYSWASLEPSPGVYNFSAIDHDLQRVQQFGKKLSIVIRYKYLTNGKSNLPAHILALAPAVVQGVTVLPFYNQDKSAENGGLEGQHANFGHPEVQDSFISLLGKLAKRYDMDLRLSFIQFTETAISATVTPGQQNNFIDGVIDMNRQAACIFYRTPLIQSINFPRSRLSDLVAGMTTHRLGLGGPDVFFGSFNDPKNSLAFVSSSAPGVYHYHPHVAGVLPIGMQVHRENLLYVTREEQLAEQPHGLSPSESVRAVHDFALQKLEPNYLVWHVFGTSDPYRQALEAILSMNASPLSLSCPQVYASRCSSGRVGTRQKRN